MLAGLILFPFVGFRKQFYCEIWEHWKLVLSVSMLQTFILYTFFNLGMTRVPSALGAIIIGSGPLITAVMAHLIMPADKLTWRKGASIIIGVVGVGVISLSRKPWSSPEGRSALIGIGLLLIASITSSLGNIVYAKALKKPNGFYLNAAQISLGGLLMFLVSVPMEGFPEYKMFTLEFLLALGWLAVLSAGAFSIWFKLLQNPSTKVSDLNVWKFIIPVCGAAIGWLFVAGETPNGPSIIGMVLVAVSVISYYRSGREPLEKAATIIS